MKDAARNAACLVLACLLAFGASARAETLVDDFSMPQPSVVKIIGLISPDPSLVKTSDAGILGGERDVLVDVMGTPNLSSVMAEIGSGLLKFAGGSPGTMATLQYDGADTDVVGPPAALANAEGLGSLNLLALGSKFAMAFDSLDGGMATATGIQIVVHSPSAVATLGALIPDSDTPSTYNAPFAAFSNPAVFGQVTSIEFRLNTGSASDVDFQLQSIKVVPEPTTLALLACGLLSALVTARRWRA